MVQVVGAPPPDHSVGPVPNQILIQMVATQRDSAMLADRYRGRRSVLGVADVAVHRLAPSAFGYENEIPRAELPLLPNWLGMSPPRPLRPKANGRRLDDSTIEHHQPRHAKSPTS